MHFFHVEILLFITIMIIIVNVVLILNSTSIHKNSLFKLSQYWL